MHALKFVQPVRVRSAIAALALLAAMPVARAADTVTAPLSRDLSAHDLHAPPAATSRHATTPRLLATHASKGAPSMQFSTDFGTTCDTPTAPAGFIVHDVDGLTPNPTIQPQSSAWTVFDDYRHGNDCVAMAVSYFSPVGVADDWLVIAAPLTPDAGTLLRWNAVAYFAGYRDGYEVRYSTAGTAPADFLANAPLLTVDAEEAVWTSHELPLATLAGTPIHIAFRNPSNDMYLLALDDISVGPRPDIDPAIDFVVDTLGDYAAVPGFLRMPFELSAQVRNAGTSNLANVAAQAQITVAGVPADTFASTPVASLAPDSSDTVLLGAGTFDTVGDWIVETRVTAAGTDGDPGNGMRADRLVTVSEMELRHADRRGLARISNTEQATYGQDFLLPGRARLDGITLAVVAEQGSSSTLSVYAQLYRWDEDARQLGELVDWMTAKPEAQDGIMLVTLEPVWMTPLQAGHYILLVDQNPDLKLLLRGENNHPETNWKVTDYTPQGTPLLSTMEEAYSSAAGLTWDFTLQLAPLVELFADGFE